MGRRLVKRGDFWAIFIAGEGRTAFPFIPEIWGDGNVNSPYIDLTKDFARVESIPEVVGFPALGDVLKVVNSPESFLQSTGADSGIVSRGDSGFAAGALVHVARRQEELNRDPETLLTLACAIASNIERPLGRMMWVELTVEPYKSWRSQSGYFGLAIEFMGLAASERDAWAAAAIAAFAIAESLIRVGEQAN